MSASVAYEDHRGPARQGPQAFFHGPELKSERPQAPGDEETAGCDATDKGLGVSRATF